MRRERNGGGESRAEQSRGEESRGEDLRILTIPPNRALEAIGTRKFRNQKDSAVEYSASRAIFTSKKRTKEKEKQKETGKGKGKGKGERKGKGKGNQHYRYTENQ